MVNHVYQRSINGVNLFYGYEDFLVFYTIFAVCAKSAGIKVLQLCIMYNHFHCLIRTSTMRELSCFMDRFTSWFVMEFNLSIGRKGKLLKKNFGSAPKWDDKAVRNSINYVGNNPVEKKLCKRAEEYRWNFLAYEFCKNPFSEPLKREFASKPLRRALTETDNMARLNLPIKYAQIRRMMKELSDKEKEQLIDYIIRKYLPFDYTELISYYGSYQNMLTAMASNTGSEYDIREERDMESDVEYDKMASYIRKQYPDKMIRSVTVLPKSEKASLAMELQRNTNASYRQICRFLHMIPNDSMETSSAVSTPGAKDIDNL